MFEKIVSTGKTGLDLYCSSTSSVVLYVVIAFVIGAGAGYFFKR